MQKFYGVQLCHLTNLLGQLQASIKASNKTQVTLGRKIEKVLLDKEMKKSWIKGTLTPMYVIAVSTNLRSTVAYLERLIQKMGLDLYVDDLPPLIQQLSERIEDDLANEMLFHVPSDKAKYYEPTVVIEHTVTPRPLFGIEADTAFPSARFDISEAGKCIALDRATACVMHLARAVEVSLKVLAEDELGLPQRYDWGKHLDDIDKELTKRYKTSGSRTDSEQFYSEAAALLGHVKVAWRNPTMHVDRKYTEEEAEGILGSINSFMKHMAKRLKEKEPNGENVRV